MDKIEEIEELYTSLNELYSVAVEGLKKLKCGPDEEAERQILYNDLKIDYAILENFISKNNV